MLTDAVATLTSARIGVVNTAGSPCHVPRMSPVNVASNISPPAVIFAVIAVPWPGTTAYVPAGRASEPSMPPSSATAAFAGSRSTPPSGPGPLANARIGTASGTIATSHAAARRIVARWPRLASRRPMNQAPIASPTAIAAMTAQTSSPSHTGCCELTRHSVTGSGT